jgi:hypothetical protein
MNGGRGGTGLAGMTRDYISASRYLRFPRPSRHLPLFDRRLGIAIIASELIPGQPLADDLPYSEVKALGVVHAFAVVISKRLLIEIPEKMKRSTLT